MRKPMVASKKNSGPEVLIRFCETFIVIAST